MRYKLIAPCGMNCAICLAYLREKNKCPGCRFLNRDIPISITRCKIRYCRIIKEKNWKYCSIKCKKFPCNRLKNLDKRYRTKYEMSMINNLNKIRELGIKKFINLEKNKCIKGNKIFCVHNKKYYNYDH